MVGIVERQQWLLTNITITNEKRKRRRMIHRRRRTSFCMYEAPPPPAHHPFNACPSINTTYTYINVGDLLLKESATAPYLQTHVSPPPPSIPNLKNLFQVRQESADGLTSLLAALEQSVMALVGGSRTLFVCSSLFPSLHFFLFLHPPTSLLSSLLVPVLSVITNACLPSSKIFFHK